MYALTFPQVLSDEQVCSSQASLSALPDFPAQVGKSVVRQPQGIAHPRAGRTDGLRGHQARGTPSEGTRSWFDGPPPRTVLQSDHIFGFRRRGERGSLHLSRLTDIDIVSSRASSPYTETSLPGWHTMSRNGAITRPVHIPSLGTPIGLTSQLPRTRTTRLLGRSTISGSTSSRTRISHGKTSGMSTKRLTVVSAGSLGTSILWGVVLNGSPGSWKRITRRLAMMLGGNTTIPLG